MPLLLILARVFHYGSGMILVGLVVFRAFIALPVFAADAETNGSLLAPLLRQWKRLLLGSVLVLVLSGALLLYAVAIDMSGTPAAEMTPTIFGTVLFETHFGSLFQLRLGLLVLLILLWATTHARLGQLRPRPSLPELALLALASALLISLTWVGHAAAGFGSSLPWRIITDALHLFASALWPTGLLPFALFLAWARQTPLAPRELILKVIGRFSALSLSAVLLLIGTGLVNSFFLVGRFSALLTTPYGRLLSLKLFFFLLILLLASWNRLRLLPALEKKGSLQEKSLLGTLQTFVLLELALACLLLIVVAVMGITAPPQ